MRREGTKCLVATALWGLFLSGVGAVILDEFHERNLASDLSLALTKRLLERGRDRFEIHCSVCHGRTGEGNGMIVQRGFPAPPSYHIDRLRDAPIGHFYDVMTRGYGVMYPQGDRIPAADRRAIVAYIRALQLSQNATLADVPVEARQALERKP